MNKRARKIGATGEMTWLDLYAIMTEHSSCHYCGIGLEPMHGSFDHVVPLDRGGRNCPRNVVRCCLTCQRSKYTKTPAEFAQAFLLTVTCPVCGKVFKPRWAEYQRGQARYCSRSCSARSRWVDALSGRS